MKISFGTDTAAGWAAYGKLDLIFYEYSKTTLQEFFAVWFLFCSFAARLLSDAFYFPLISRNRLAQLLFSLLEGIFLLEIGNFPFEILLP